MKQKHNDQQVFERSNTCFLFKQLVGSAAFVNVLRKRTKSLKVLDVTYYV